MPNIKNHLTNVESLIPTSHISEQHTLNLVNKMTTTELNTIVNGETFPIIFSAIDLESPRLVTALIKKGVNLNIKKTKRVWGNPSIRSCIKIII